MNRAFLHGGFHNPCLYVHFQWSPCTLHSYSENSRASDSARIEALTREVKTLAAELTASETARTHMETSISELTRDLVQLQETSGGMTRQDRDHWEQLKVKYSRVELERERSGTPSSVRTDW